MPKKMPNQAGKYYVNIIPENPNYVDKKLTYFAKDNF